MNILFVCTHNRCRNILCEAISNYLANGKIKAASAGSPAAPPDPEIFAGKEYSGHGVTQQVLG